jgi:hypothetical protein
MQIATDSKIALRGSRFSSLTHKGSWQRDGWWARSQPDCWISVTAISRSGLEAGLTGMEAANGAAMMFGVHRSARRAVWVCDAAAYRF